MDQQISVFDVAVSDSTATKPIINDPDAFGCCSRYRQCSDEKRCVISDYTHSAHCAYRKNLENGRIFYGKNADGFSLNAYYAYRQRVNGLSASDIEYCFWLLTYFFEKKRGANYIIVDNDKRLNDLVDIGLFKVSPCGDYIIQVCAYRKLMEVLKNHPIYGPLWSARKGKDRSKNAVITWIQENAPQLIVDIGNPYRMVTIPSSARLYAMEMYYDDCFNQKTPYKVPDDPLTRDGFIGKGDTA